MEGLSDRKFTPRLIPPEKIASLKAQIERFYPKEGMPGISASRVLGFNDGKERRLTRPFLSAAALKALNTLHDQGHIVLKRKEVGSRVDYFVFNTPLEPPTTKDVEGERLAEEIRNLLPGYGVEKANEPLTWFIYLIVGSKKVHVGGFCHHMGFWMRTDVSSENGDGVLPVAKAIRETVRFAYNSAFDTVFNGGSSDGIDGRVTE